MGNIEAANLLRVVEPHVCSSTGLVLVNVDESERLSAARLRGDLGFDVQADCGFLLLRVLVNAPQYCFRSALTARLRGVDASSWPAALDVRF